MKSASKTYTMNVFYLNRSVSVDCITRPCGVCKDTWEDDELYLCEGGCMECCLGCVVFDEEGCALCPSCAQESIV